MNTPPRPTPRPKASRLHTKLLILSVSLSGTMLLWNLFARQDINKVLAENTAKDDNANNTVDIYGLAPLPTLVDVGAAGNLAASGGILTVSQPANSGLRSVAQPTPLPKIDKPQVETITIVQQAPGTSGSSSRGSSSAPVTSSKSSK
jgi:hypothetical protein